MSSTRRAECLANRQFARTRGCARDQQARHVDAHDEKHESHRGEQDHEQRSHVARQARLRVLETERPVQLRRVVVRVCLLQLRDEEIQAALRLLECQTRRVDDASAPVNTRARRIGGEGKGGAMKPAAPQMSTSLLDVLPGCRNSGGMTPMIVYGSSSTRMRLPMTFGSAPNSRCQSASLMTTPSRNPGRHFACVYTRPSAALAPSISK